jgi:tetratricopeptide (TPR) repeat protein
VKQQLAAVGTPGVATAGSREKLARAAMEEQLGDQEYAAGNLDEAKAHYDQAFTYMDKALKNDKDPNTFKLLEPTGTLLLGIGMVLLALGVIGFVLRRPKGPPGT